MINAVILPFSTRAFDHNSTLNRDAADAHPKSAITGLEAALSDRYTKAEADALLVQKQKKLIAGANINLNEDGTISASGKFSSTWGLLGGDISDQEDLMEITSELSAGAQQALTKATTADGKVDAEVSARESADEAITAKMTNRNLLDNPWFTINQRDVHVWTSGYGVDRWAVTGGQATKTDVGVSLDVGTSLVQQLPSKIKDFLDNKTVTLSVNVAGVVTSGTATYKKNEQVIFFSDYGFNLFTTSSGNVCIQTKMLYGIEFAAAKLELGSLSTLSNDAPPDYGEELRKCMRYFQRVKAGSTPVTLCIGMASSTSAFYFAIQSAVPMRTAPAFSCDAGPSGQLFLITKTTSGAAVGFVDTADIRASDGNYLNHTFYFSKSGLGLVTGDPYKIILNSGAYFDMSSEL